MIRYDNNILILILKNGEKRTYSFQSSVTRKEGLFMALQSDKIDPNYLDKAYFIPQSKIGSVTFNDTLDPQTGIVDLKTAKINEKLPILRKERSLILQKLDIELMKLAESEDSCDACKRHLTKIKNYLRDAPKKFSNYDFKSLEEIEFFNIFDNVFEIIVTEKGSGYNSPPEIKIERPNAPPSLPGFALDGVAIVENGSLKEILVTQVGSSYISVPKIEIAPPDEEGGIQAQAIASPPENGGHASNFIAQMINAKIQYEQLVNKQ